jgi:Tc5 transposase DNA-binding domain/helix-turn-helix, Psq domain
MEIEQTKRGPYAKKYTAEDLRTALDEVGSGSLSVYAASKKFNIPKQTLNDKVQAKHSSNPRSEKILSEVEENRLVAYILLNADAGNPLIKSQILKIAGEIASLNPDPTKHFKNGSASPSWLDNFIKRHPEISRRTPSNLGRASAIHSKEDLKLFFDRVYNHFREENLLYLLERPELWWNADETGFEMNPSPKKVYARKGQKTVYNVERGKPKAMVTATYAFSGDGNFIEPLLTFKKSLSSITEIAVAIGCKFFNVF